jgi:membrane-bound lytic murein transglycosylase D
MILARIILFFLLLSFIWVPSHIKAEELSAEETPFPLLPGLEGAVEFWKLVFTRYGAAELIFHDPLDPPKIYKVVVVGEGNPATQLVEEERARILEEAGFAPDEKRVRVQRGVKERFLSGLKRSGRYIGQIQRIFREEGLPADLAYLPLVESSFDIHARSRVGALGMWQFMPTTGKQFLRVSRTVDERRDPVESTRAAARFLKRNHEILGSWPLAITAYNHGREGILRATNEVGSKDLMEIIQHYQGPAFGFASKSFYAEFLAAVDVAKRSEEYFPDLEFHPAIHFEEFEVKRSVSIASLLKPTEIERKQFLEWNPALHPQIKDIPSGYRVKFPADKHHIFLTAYRKLVKAILPAPAVASVKESQISSARHRVARGETLAEIAKKYNVSVREIQQANSLGNSHLITAGKYLKIPNR